MKIPYGQSNFADIRRGGFFYVDKTPFLPVLESAVSDSERFLGTQEFARVQQPQRALRSDEPR